MVVSFLKRVVSITSIQTEGNSLRLSIYSFETLRRPLVEGKKTVGPKVLVLPPLFVIENNEMLTKIPSSTCTYIYV